VTRQQRWIVAGLTMAIALTRIYALSRSLWDWDEALFSMSVRAYDVTQHHPHPPGFPLFIVAAKLLRLLLHSDFRAVQAVTLLGAVALFPALFMLARELRFPFAVSVAGAALYAFFPTVWLFGGTAFSDVAATALVLAACAFLLRGCRDRGAFLLGALLLGVAAGFRTQNLLIGCVPALYATWCRIRQGAWRDVAAAIAIGAGIVAASYTGAAYASADPPRGYLDAMANLRVYVSAVDSFFNPARPPLPALVADVFVRPTRSGLLDYAILALAALGLVATVRRFGTLMALAMFVPFQLFAWLMLDPNSMARYGTAYLPLYALLAAAGAGVLRFYRIDVAIVALLVACFIVIALPALRVVRSGDSPPVAAMREILRLHPAQTVFVHGGMSPYADYFLTSLPKQVVRDDELPADIAHANALYVVEGVKPAGAGRTFSRPHGRLWSFVRHRYFEVAVTTVGELWRFGDGWYDEEGEGGQVYRWMGGRSVTGLPPIAPRARLGLTIGLPHELVAAAPTLTVELNGTVVDRVRCTTESISKTWDIAARTAGPNELVLSMDRVLNPQRQHLSSDARDLGLRLDSYTWSALP
jgi:hypothetical protein